MINQAVLLEEKKAISKAELRGYQDKLIAQLLENEGILAEDKKELIVPDFKSRYLPFPLTEVQQAYLIGRDKSLDLGRVSTHSYIEFNSTELESNRIQLAWQRLIERHDMLRTLIHPDGYQQILKKTPLFHLNVLDLRQASEKKKEQLLREVREEMSHQVLSPNQWPLFDVRFTYIDDERVRLHYSFDGLIIDVSSMPIIFEEQGRFYENPQLNLPPLEISFRDYVVSLQKIESSDAYSKAKRFWQDTIATMPPAPELPMVKTPASIKKPRFKRLTCSLDAERWQSIKQRAKSTGIAPTFVVMTAFVEVLKLWGRTQDFTLNLTLSNRKEVHPDINQVVGDFTDLLLLSFTHNPSENFLQRATDIQDSFWDRMEYRIFDGIKVMRELSLYHGDQSRGAMPIVFTSSIFIGDVDTIMSIGTKALKQGYTVSQTPQVTIDHQVYERNGRLDLVWDVLDEIFPDDMLDDMLVAYSRLLESLADYDDVWQQPVMVPIPSNQQELRASTNATRSTIPSETLHGLFEAQVRQRPSDLAFVSSKISLTYQALFARTTQVCGLLQDRHIQPNTLVAIVMEKGWQQIVAALGILQAGAAYLPIDPSLPQERLVYLLENGEVNIVLTQSDVVSSINFPENIECVIIDSDIEARSPKKSNNQKPSLPSTSNTVENLAYVIFTSGSTGKPKGVMIDHRGAVNTILDINERFNVLPHDKVFALSNLNFDLSVYDIFGTLAAGATIVMPDHTRAKDPAHWVDLMAAHHVTIWNSVPMQLQMLYEYLIGRELVGPEDLRLALLSGDWIPLDLPKKFKALSNHTNVISLGGATEASIWSILYPIEEISSEWKSIPYGKPMVNQQVYVFNDTLNTCPDWVTGEIYIGGIGVAKGYWRDKEKSNTAFIIHPQTNERLYRTGDLGRNLPDGNIEFLGRQDFQVKVNGHRIELGEIESTVRILPGIKDAIVSVVKSEPNACTADDEHKEKHLVGYLVPDYSAPSQLFDVRISDKTLCKKQWDQLTKVGRRYSVQIPESIDLETIPPSFDYMDQLSVSLICKILTALGIFANPGESYKLDELLQKFGILSRYRTLVRHWLNALTEERLLNKSRSGIYSNPHAFSNEDAEYYLQSCAVLPSELVEWADNLTQYLQKGLSQYPGFLRGESDPLQSFLSDYSTLRADLLSKFSLTQEYYVNIASRMFETIIKSTSGIESLHVLEVGTRVGTLTAALSSKMPRNGKYLYVDESSFFTDKIKQKLKSIESIEYGLFDMNKDPSQQGYTSHSFNVIIADNTLHRAKDIDKTLAYLKSLLVPGGLLFFVEPTRNNRLMLVSVALFEDGFSHLKDLRKDRSLPLMSADMWQQQLRKSGFSTIESFPHADQEAHHFQQHVIIAQVSNVINVFDPAKVAEVVKQKLPDYMVPTHWVVLQKIPLSPNGKVDRKALSELDNSMNFSSTADFVAPSTESEILLAKIWDEILGCSRVSIHDSFFASGGDSLRAIQCINLLREQYQIDLSLQEFMESNTIDELAKVISKKQTSNKTMSDNYDEGLI